MSREFRLKRIRELREREVEQELVVLSEYQQKLTELNRSAENVQVYINKEQESLLDGSKDGMSVAELRQRTMWIRQLMAARSDLARQCHEADERVEQQRNLLLELHRDERVLKRLETRHEKRVKKERLRRLEEQLDEVRLQNYQGKRGGD